MLGFEVFGVIVLLVLAVAVIILFKILKGAASFLIFALVGFIVVSGILTVLVYKDVAEISSKGVTEPKTIIIYKTDSVTESVRPDAKTALTALFSFRAVSFNDFNDNSMSWLNEQEISIADQKLKSGSYDDLNSGSYKLLLINIDALAKGSIELWGSPVPSEEVVAALKSDEPINENLIISGKLGSQPQYGEYEMRQYLIAKLLSQKLDAESAISEYDSGRIKIYPETITFKMLKVVPGGTKMLSGLFEQ